MPQIYYCNVVSVADADDRYVLISIYNTFICFFLLIWCKFVYVYFCPSEVLLCCSVFALVYITNIVLE